MLLTIPNEDIGATHLALMEFCICDPQYGLGLGRDFRVAHLCSSLISCMLSVHVGLKYKKTARLAIISELLVANSC